MRVDKECPFSSVQFRAQELCESRGGRPVLPVPNIPYGLCGREATLNLNSVQFNSVQGGIYALGKAHNLCTPPRLSEVYPTLHLKQLKSPISGVPTVLPYEAVLCEQINLQTRLRKLTLYRVTAMDTSQNGQTVGNSLIKMAETEPQESGIATFATSNVLLTFTTLTNHQRREQAPGTNYHNSQSKPTNLTTNGLNLSLIHI